MTLSEELKWRGFINQTTYSDLSVLDSEKITFYHGFDASADSQTVGNLAAMMLDRLFMRHNHQGIILAGGATSLIGDPGGKDTERPLQDEATIAANIDKAEVQLRKILRGYDFKLVNNLDWTKELKVIDFLRDYGKHFSMTPLIQRDYISKRLGEGASGISYAEFSYTVLQGMDFLHLYDAEGVTLQLGGSDQWGNCLSGVELIRKARGAEAHVITLPLIINKATGNKFGKTEEGAIWLDPNKTSSTQFYQFWINIEDNALEEYLKIFTELDKPTIEETLDNHFRNPGHRYGQRILAHHATALVHGQESAGLAEEITDIITDRSNLEMANNRAFEALKNEIGTAKASAGSGIVNALVESGLAQSNSDARRLLSAGAIYINGISIIRETFESDDFKNGRLILRRGKAFKDSAIVEEA